LLNGGELQNATDIQCTVGHQPMNIIYTVSNIRLASKDNMYQRHIDLYTDMWTKPWFSSPLQDYLRLKILTTVLLYFKLFRRHKPECLSAGLKYQQFYSTFLYGRLQKTSDFSWIVFTCTWWNTSWL